MRNEPALTLYDICLKVTSKFEGTDFGTVVGNFDGNGVSAGILQWSLGQGTLQSYILNHINPMMYDFPLPITNLIGLNKQAALVWHKDNCCDENGDMKQ